MAEWVRGASRRPVPVDARGASLGLALAPLGEPLESSAPQPGSCAEDLRSLLPVPDQPQIVLLSSTEGELFRYQDGRLHPMLVGHPVPPVGELLGFAARATPLRMLVSTDGDQLWELEIGGAEVLTAIRVGEGPQFADREALLEHYRVGRCTRGTHDCLTLVRDDTGLTVDRRAEPDAEPEIVISLGRTHVADVGYADASGSMVYLLTPMACAAPPESARGAGLVEPEASP